MIPDCRISSQLFWVAVNASGPTSRSTCSVWIRSRTPCSPRAGSSRNTSSTGRPRMPPAALMSSAANCGPLALPLRHEVEHGYNADLDGLGRFGRAVAGSVASSVATASDNANLRIGVEPTPGPAPITARVRIGRDVRSTRRTSHARPYAPGERPMHEGDPVRGRIGRSDNLLAALGAFVAIMLVAVVLPLGGAVLAQDGSPPPDPPPAPPARPRSPAPPRRPPAPALSTEGTSITDTEYLTSRSTRAANVTGPRTLKDWLRVRGTSGNSVSSIQDPAVFEGVDTLSGSPRSPGRQGDPRLAGPKLPDEEFTDLYYEGEVAGRRARACT